jgi:pSer/pThr/pTyr-binding forkhead associated (FHA) protein
LNTSNQIYAAGRINNQQYNETNIKEFLNSSMSLKDPSLTCYETNSKILHSLLILFQKKPTMKFLTSIVDLDQLLDRIETEGKSCIVSATQDNFLAILRYEKGKASAMCHQTSQPFPSEENFREDFLVKIYTLSTEKQVDMSVYEDLLVKYADDAKTISESFDGSIVDLYLSKPPTVTLQFKDKEIDQFVLDKQITKIGRTSDNDIVIDNLAVSRLHATIENSKGEYFIQDCDSLNGTLLNKNRVGRSKLEEGDIVCIGKHDLIFRAQLGQNTGDVSLVNGLDQTMILKRNETPAPQMIKTAADQSPRLLEKTPHGEKVIELTKQSLILGNTKDADIEITGFLVAKKHAEIVRENGHFVIRHLKGLRKVKVSGKRINQCVLKPNDKIEIANKEFIFLG